MKQFSKNIVKKHSILYSKLKHRIYLWILMLIQIRIYIQGISKFCSLKNKRKVIFFRFVYPENIPNYILHNGSLICTFIYLIGKECIYDVANLSNAGNVSILNFPGSEKVLLVNSRCVCVYKILQQQQQQQIIGRWCRKKPWRCSSTNEAPISY